MSHNCKVVVVGVGNLGRRHLQSLSLCKNEIDAFVIDPSQHALCLAEDVISESKFPGPVHYLNSFAEWDGNVDLAIVATTADSRLPIIKELLTRNVKYMILEKIAFNSIVDLESAQLLLGQWKGSAWVNCPRRGYYIYSLIKSMLAKRKITTFTINGNDYGLACNGIHFIDLLSFLVEESIYDFKECEITGIVDGKRNGYVEFYGTLTGEFQSGCTFSLACRERGEVSSYMIHIAFEGGSIAVDEFKGTMVANIDGKEIYESFKIPYQSQLTGPMVDQIIEEGKSYLPSFAESMIVHRPFIEKSYEIYSNIYGKNEKMFVPIT